MHKTHALLLLLLFLPCRGFALLLEKQPILNQMIGNCYVHTGLNTMVSIYAKDQGITDHIVQPHPILFGGLLAGERNEAEVSGGYDCAVINGVKDLKSSVCSVEGFESFLANQRTSVTVSNFRSNIDSFDSALEGLNDLFEDATWDEEQKNQALDHAREIIRTTCAMNGVMDFENPEFLKLLDDSRKLISRLSPKQAPQEAAKTEGGFFKRLFGQVKKTFTNMSLSGVGPYFFRRINQVKDYISFRRERRGMVNKILKEVYRDMNDRCLAYEEEKGLPSIPDDFIKTVKKYRCSGRRYDYVKVTPFNDGIINSRLDAIEKQVANDLATPISVCSGMFYSRAGSSIRDRFGNCANGGEHAVTVVGVKKVNGKRFFEIRNSWGVDSCHGVESGFAKCGETKAKDCPTAEQISCKDGIYTIDDSYLSTAIYGDSIIRKRGSWLANFINL